MRRRRRAQPSPPTHPRPPPLPPPAPLAQYKKNPSAGLAAFASASAAHAIAQHVHDWLLGSAGAAVSMAVFTDEESASAGYCAAQGIVFSQPVVCDRGGAWRIARGLPVDAHARAMLSATEKELVEERGLAFAAVAQPPA